MVALLCLPVAVLILLIVSITLTDWQDYGN